MKSYEYTKRYTRRFYISHGHLVPYVTYNRDWVAVSGCTGGPISPEPLFVAPIHQIGTTLSEYYFTKLLIWMLSVN